MNKEMRKNLEAVVDAIVNEDTEKATSAFHNYLRAKTKEVLAEAADDSSEDDKPAKGKKGVNPFTKKDKSEDDKSEDDKSEDDKSEDDDSSEEDKSEDDSSEDDKPTKGKKGVNPFAKKK